MSANNDYKLGRVGSGDNIRTVARSSRINALQNISRSHVSGDQYARASGSQRSIGPGWVVNRSSRTLFRGGVTTFHRPWEITIVTDANNNTVARVRPGTVNSMLPSNMFQDLPVDIYATYYIVVHVTTNGQNPTDLTMVSTQNPPGPPGSNLWVAPFDFDILIGVIVQLKVFQIINDPLTVHPKISIQTLNPNPQPGVPYLDNNYTWDISSQ